MPKLVLQGAKSPPKGVGETDETLDQYQCLPSGQAGSDRAQVGVTELDSKLCSFLAEPKISRHDFVLPSTSMGHEDTAS